VHICEAEAGKSRQVLKKRAAEGMGGGGGIRGSGMMSWECEYGICRIKILDRSGKQRCERDVI
jgi:hypothetical protein